MMMHILMVARGREVPYSKRSRSRGGQFARDGGFVSGPDPHRSRSRAGRIADFDDSRVDPHIRVPQASRKAGTRLPVDIFRFEVSPPYSDDCVGCAHLENGQLAATWSNHRVQTALEQLDEGIHFVRRAN